MKPILNNILIEKNKHLRDKNIQFFEEGHKYTILSDANSKYTSVTTWCHSHFPHFDADAIIDSMMKGKGWKEGHKYWGLDANKIKSQWNINKDIVAEAGSDLHFEIECFHNNIQISNEYSNNELYEKYISDNPDYILNKSIEWQYFINFIKDNLNLKPYRTEWLVYHEDVKIAGSIDMIYENSDGTLSIYDWKRAKNITRINNYNKFAISKQICHLPDSNFWHYALQLNTYKTIIEQKYNKKIRDLFLVRLHPSAEELNYELIKLPDLSIEINDLFTERIEKINKQITI
jgi:ATP-dependent exoDNAse (exonuclease V) beta subunit